MTSNHGMGQPTEQHCSISTQKWMTEALLRIWVLWNMNIRLRSTLNACWQKNEALRFEIRSIWAFRRCKNDTSSIWNNNTDCQNILSGQTLLIGDPVYPLRSDTANFAPQKKSQPKLDSVRAKSKVILTKYYFLWNFCINQRFWMKYVMFSFSSRCR